MKFAELEEEYDRKKEIQKEKNEEQQLVVRIGKFGS